MNEHDATARLQRALAEIEATIDAVCARWPMLMRDPHDAENHVVELLVLRAVLLGAEPLDLRAFRYERYPGVPGPVRCAAEAVRARLWASGEASPDAYRDALTEELTSMAREYRARTDCVEAPT